MTLGGYQDVIWRLLEGWRWYLRRTAGFSRETSATLAAFTPRFPIFASDWRGALPQKVDYDFKSPREAGESRQTWSLTVCVAVGNSGTCGLKRRLVINFLRRAQTYPREGKSMVPAKPQALVLGSGPKR